MIHARFDLAYPDFSLNVDMQLPARGVSALFGPSASGKTTLLRCIAGLERAAGMLSVGGDIWQDSARFLAVHKRPVGYVFQEASLFPHLSVRANLEYGYRRVVAAERKVELEQVVAWLGLSKLIGRSSTAALSGGERQRIAIARALLSSPRLLLMDEPLAALDAASKQEILGYLERMQRELEIPVIYVSHTLDEVARLADHLLLLEAGRVIASGALPETLARLDLPTAHLDESGVLLPAVVAEHDRHYHLTRLQFGGGELWVALVKQAVGDPVRARILARDVSIATQRPQPSSITNILAARISGLSAEGADKVNVRMTVGDSHALLARITRRSCEQLGLAEGMPVFAQVKSVAVMA